VGETYIFEVRDSDGDCIFSYDTAYNLTLEGALIFESNGDFAYEESHAFCVGCGDDQAIEGEPSAFCAEYEHLEPASGLRPCSYYCVANKCVAEVDSDAAMQQRYHYFNDLNINGFDAWAYCYQNSMSLLTINDAEESQLVNLITGCEDDVNVWITWNKYSPYLNEIFQRDGGTWTTVDMPLDNGGYQRVFQEISFTQWHIGEPHDAYTDCATLTSREGRMGWAATSCWSTTGVICEEKEPE